MSNHKINLWNLTIKIIFLLQTITGILGNFSLLIQYLVCYTKHRLKHTDLMLMHLWGANALIVLFTGVPHTMAAFGLKQFLNDFGCRLTLYIQRVGRSVSIGTTCFLSVFQAITISHRESCCNDQKAKVAKYIGCSISLLWVLSMFIHFIFFREIFLKRNSKNMTRKLNFEYCSVVNRGEMNETLYVALVMCPEIVFSVLMAWSSGSMIVILYRHKKRVQHIHSSQVSNRNSPESRATQNILSLVSSFLAFYSLSSILQGCISLSHNHSWCLLMVTILISLCFPTFAPFVLINYYSVLPRLSLVWISKNSSKPVSDFSLGPHCCLITNFSTFMNHNFLWPNAISKLHAVENKCFNKNNDVDNKDGDGEDDDKNNRRPSQPAVTMKTYHLLIRHYPFGDINKKPLRICLNQEVDKLSRMILSPKASPVIATADEIEIVILEEGENLQHDQPQFLIVQLIVPVWQMRVV
uniref:vomeronasal type-1 receptor 4-like n=1 Tax=Arvicanthis niloticus TaxID=61156 RepID=UPI00402B62A0